MKSLKSQQIAFITGGLMIVASLIAFYLLKLPIESNFQLIIYLIFSGGIVWSLINSFTNDANKKAFKDYFSVGFKTFIIVTLLLAIYTFIFFSLHTDFRDAKIAENNVLILKEGNHLPKEIEENSNQLKKLFLPIMVSSTVFRYLIIGALVTAVGAGFLSNKKSKENIKV